MKKLIIVSVLMAAILTGCTNPIPNWEKVEGDEMERFEGSEVFEGWYQEEDYFGSTAQIFHISKNDIEKLPEEMQHIDSYFLTKMGDNNKYTAISQETFDALIEYDESNPAKIKVDSVSIYTTRSPSMNLTEILN